VLTGKNQALAGVPTTSLRREVINRMVRETDGWSTTIRSWSGGRAVYVVVAQSQVSGGRINSRMFYFTEADGRIYSVATTTAAESAEKLAEESEKGDRLAPEPDRVPYSRHRLRIKSPPPYRRAGRAHAPALHSLTKGYEFRTRSKRCIADHSPGTS
jgi:hypothetical protein